MLITKQHSNTKISVTGQDIPYMNKKHIFDLWNMATETDKNTNWYKDENAFVTSLATEYGMSCEKVAYLISAISPQTKWEKNKFYAKQALVAYDAVTNGWLERQSMPKVHKYSAMSNNGYAVLFGENFKLGQKTTSFAKNLLGDMQEVTVDSLAMSILLGFYRKAGSYKISNKAYKHAQKLYTEVASVLGVAPAHLQAVTWVTCRKLKKQDKGYNLLYVSGILGRFATPTAVLQWLAVNDI